MAIERRQTEKGSFPKHLPNALRVIPLAILRRVEILSILIRKSTYMAKSKITAKKQPARFLTARETADALGVSLATLYAYVSRGMLRSEPVSGNPRERRYLRDDVARLVERKEIRRDPNKAAARSLSWGAPVLDSSLTLIDGGRLYYRGRDALELAGQSTVEEVAALLWTGDPGRAGALFEKSNGGVPRGLRGLFTKASHLGMVERCQLALPVGAATDLGAYDLRPEAVARTGARILRLLTFAVCGAQAAGPVDVALQESWLPRRKAAAPALRAALILCADHELNVSAFTARCVASARATPYEVVAGALAALKGRRHGGYTSEVEALFREAGKARGPREILADRLRKGDGLIGFGHPLYPDGDPRAVVLLSFAKKFGRGSALEWSDEFIEMARDLTGEHPTIDFALVILARSLGLPAGAPLTLFALGRAVGWIAHAIEQYDDSRMIRPRARYVGPAPESPAANRAESISGKLSLSGRDGQG
jgi:citrate synthase